MEDDSDTLQVKKKIFPTTLQILTSIYALLYLIFIIENFFSSKDFNPYDLENIIVNIP
jgi:hypothetical protein